MIEAGVSVVSREFHAFLPSEPLFCSAAAPARRGPASTTPMPTTMRARASSARVKRAVRCRLECILQ